MTGPATGPTRAAAWVDRVVAVAAAGPARLGATRLLCVDGPSGSGKTTLARAVAARTDAALVHLDDLYPGWDGLFEVDRPVLDLLGPLAEGQPGSYRRYDWHAGAYAETRTVHPAPVLVLEGVGAGNRAWRALVTTLVWVEAPRAVRLARGVARDGEAARAHLVAWMRDEDRLFAEQGTRDAADLVVDTGAHG